MQKPTDKSQTKQRIIADIGGTNARFALLDTDASINNQMVLKGADHSGFISAYQEYLRLVGNPEITEAAIAIANPIDGDVITMTNHDWVFSIEEARRVLTLDSLIFKNDFEALAMSIPFLESKDLNQVGGGNIKKKKAIGVLGPGTGLGVSGLVYAGEKWIPIAGEGGHVSLSPTTPREIQILEACLKRYDHVSAERLISGQGLQLIYSLICEIDQITVNPNLSAIDISHSALNQTNPQCEEALELFTGLLGGVAGNLAVTLGAKGGIYIGGGIIPKLGNYFESSPFRERFEAKGRFKKYLEEIPVFVIQSKYPALIGIKHAFNT